MWTKPWLLLSSYEQSSSSSSAFPSYISELHHLGWDFCICDRFFIQPLRQSHSVFAGGASWVFLLSAFTHLKHQCQDLLSRAMERMFAHSRPRCTLSSVRVLGEWNQPMLTPREISPLPEKILLKGGWNPRPCIKQDSEPSTIATSYSGPLWILWLIELQSQSNEMGFPF